MVAIQGSRFPETQYQVLGIPKNGHLVFWEVLQSAGLLRK